MQEKEHSGVENLSKLLEEDKAVVPKLWHLETVNVLVTSMRRDRRDVDWLEEKFRALDTLDIKTDDKLRLRDALDLAVKHGLSCYDAAYLELAKRLNLPLATFDKALIRAAIAEGVSLTCQ